MDQITETWRRLAPRHRLMLVGAVLGTVISLLALAQFATRPGMALLYSGLDPATAGEVLAALEQMNVPSEVRGDAIYVDEAERDRVRLALAREGLPRQGQAGYELLDGISGFSATTDMFNAAYWRAKEGELARTIVSSPGVRAARVHIAMPDRRPFQRGEAQPSAAVTVTMSAGVLPEAQAVAIRYLVALAVPGMDPDQVAIIDSRAGVILAPGRDAPAAQASAAAAAREARLQAEIERLLAARVGRDRARVSVTVETDREAERVSEKLIQPDTRVVISSETEELSDSSSGSNGAVTVASNLPDGDAAATGTRQSARAETRERTNYEYSELRRERVREPGAIRRISVAVLVDGVTRDDGQGGTIWEPRPAEEIDALRELVKAAIGYDEARGDRVTVESMRFEADATPGTLVEASPWRRLLERNAMRLIQLGILAVVALVLVFAVIRPLLAAGARTRVAEEPTPALPPAAAAEAAAQPSAGHAAEAETAPRPDGEALRALVAERPDEAAATLREWLSADEEMEAA